MIRSCFSPWAAESFSRLDFREWIDFLLTSLFYCMVLAILPRESEIILSSPRKSLRPATMAVPAALLAAGLACWASSGKHRGFFLISSCWLRIISSAVFFASSIFLVAYSSASARAFLRCSCSLSTSAATAFFSCSLYWAFLVIMRAFAFSLAACSFCLAA